MIASFALWAADKHSGQVEHSQHNTAGSHNTELQENGQAAFAALIEVVAILEQDDSTDWGNVDIDGLRAHLQDMNNLMLYTQANKTITADTQIQFDITGTAQSIPSIHRMVPAHSGFIEQSRGWVIEHELNDSGATVKITVQNTDYLKRINALGFYGFMSLDSHHQTHHNRLAMGMSH